MADDKAREIERMIEVVVRSIPKERQARDLYRKMAQELAFNPRSKMGV